MDINKNKIKKYFNNKKTKFKILLYKILYYKTNEI